MYQSYSQQSQTKQAGPWPGVIDVMSIMYGNKYEKQHHEMQTQTVTK